jgi:hypothetical protein
VNDKSYVTLEQNVCVVCAVLFDTGAVLLNKRLRPVFEHTTITDWGLCPKCTELHAQGYVALVEAKAPANGAETINPVDVIRTGRVAFIRRSAWEKIFDIPPPANNAPCTFVQEGMVAMLEKKLGGAVEH